MPTGNGSPVRTRLKQKVEVTIPVPALSTNKLYSGRKHRSYHYKAFRKKVFKVLDEQLGAEKFKLTGNLKLTMVVGFSSPLSDLSNSVKGIEDVLTEFLGFNDRQITSIELTKVLVNKGEEFMYIEIGKTNKNVDRRCKKP